MGEGQSQKEPQCLETLLELPLLTTTCNSIKIINQNLSTHRFDPLQIGTSITKYAQLLPD